MKKKIVQVLLLVFMIFLTSCSNEKSKEVPETVSDDLQETPMETEPEEKGGEVNQMNEGSKEEEKKKNAKKQNKKESEEKGDENQKGEKKRIASASELKENLSGKVGKVKMKIDAEKKAESLEWFNLATEYSQSYDGHYYYMRKGKGNTYTLYQDSGKKVVEYDTGKYSLGGCCRVDKHFYVQLIATESGEDDGEDGYKLADVDLATGDITFLLDFPNNVNSEILFYSEKIVYFNLDEGEIEIYNANGEKIKSLVNKQIIWDQFLGIIDGKVFYEKKDKKKEHRHTLRYMDLKTGKDKEFIQFEHTNTEKKSSYVGLGVFWQNGGIFVTETSSDSKGNFFYDLFWVPLKDGGEIRCVAKSILEGPVVNSKYVFYIDKKHLLHRIDRKTWDDQTISSTKFSEVECVGNQLFAKKYSSWYDETEVENISDNYADTLYTLNFDGKNKKRIQKGTGKLFE